MDATGKVWHALSRWTCGVFVALTVLHHGVRCYVEPDWCTDKSLQVAAAQSLLRGEGIGYDVVQPEALSSPQHMPLVQWPPGYSLVLATPLWLTGDVNLAGLVVDWLALVVFCLSWWKIADDLGPVLGEVGRPVLWILWAATLAPLLDTSTGVLALACYSAGLALVLRSVTSPDGAAWRSALSGFCVGMCAWLRYAYWPLGVVLPLGLAYGAWLQERRLWSAALLQALVFGAMLLALVVHQHRETGHATFLGATYVNQSQRGFWPEELLRTCPFPSHVFRWDVALEYRCPQLDSATILHLQWAFSGVVLLVFVAEVVRHCIVRNTRPAAAQGSVFFFVAALTLLLTVAMLGALSMRYGRPGSRWTYVAELRYYAPVLVFLSAALCTWGFGGAALGSRRGMLRLAVVALMLYLPARFFAQPKSLWNQGAALAKDATAESLCFGRDFGPFARALEEGRGGAERCVYIEDPVALASGQKYALALVRGMSLFAHGHRDDYFEHLRTSEPVRVLALTRRGGEPTAFQAMLQRQGASWITHIAAWNADVYAFDLQPTPAK